MFMLGRGTSLLYRCMIINMKCTTPHCQIGAIFFNIIGVPRLRSWTDNLFYIHYYDKVTFIIKIILYGFEIYKISNIGNQLKKNWVDNVFLSHDSSLIKIKYIYIVYK